MQKLRRNKTCPPYIIGLTGSIGMGKSTIARMFAHAGAAVCDSDNIVHRLLGSRGAAVKKVAILFPNTLGEHGIDRKALGAEVFNNSHKLKQLEAILHPLVRREQERFIARMRRLGKKIVVLDIPLLFETGAEKRCNSVVVVHAPAFIQRQRVLARSGMTREKFTHILAHQMPSREKCRRADVVIATGLGKAVSYKKVRYVMRNIAQ